MIYALFILIMIIALNVWHYKWLSSLTQEERNELRAQVDEDSQRWQL